MGVPNKGSPAFGTRYRRSFAVPPPNSSSVSESHKRFDSGIMRLPPSSHHPSSTLQNGGIVPTAPLIFMGKVACMSASDQLKEGLTQESSRDWARERPSSPAGCPEQALEVLSAGHQQRLDIRVH